MGPAPGAPGAGAGAAAAAAAARPEDLVQKIALHASCSGLPDAISGDDIFVSTPASCSCACVCARACVRVCVRACARARAGRGAARSDLMRQHKGGLERY